MISRIFTSIAGSALLGLAFFAAASPAAADTTWTADPGHSIAQFTVRHLGFTKVSGSILIRKATVTTPQASTMPSAIFATLDAASIDTRNSDRDHDLRGPDWLDVGRYPTIAFTSTGIIPGEAGSFQVNGDLTIHGITKPVGLAAHFDGTSVDGRGHKRLSYSASTSIDRRDFALLWANTTPGGSIVAGNDVAIDLALEVVAP